MSEIKFSCGKCGKHFVCDGEFAGRQFTCPVCKTDVSIPSAIKKAGIPAPITVRMYQKTPGIGGGDHRAAP
jgi:hypothetical protein